MAPPPAESGGFLGALQSLGAGLLAGLHDRIELFSLELQEEKFRLIQTALWISAIAFTGLLTLTFASLALVCLFWETARLAVLGGLTLFYAGTLVALVHCFRQYLKRQPHPLAATRQEIAEDCAGIRRAP